MNCNTSVSVPHILEDIISGTFSNVMLTSAPPPHRSLYDNIDTFLMPDIVLKTVL